MIRMTYRQVILLGCALGILAGLCFSAKIASGCCGQFHYSPTAKATQKWDWSPRAVHHAAACKVRSGNQGGSGTYIEYKGLRGVVTVAHVTEGGSATPSKVEVTFSDGLKVVTSSTRDKYKNDISFIFVTHPTIKPLQVAAKGPIYGEKVEFVTYGGPNKRQLRHFWATVESFSADDNTYYACDVISGDSGGGILNLKHEFIGLEAFGRSETIRKDWGAYHGGGGPNHKKICEFFDRIIEKFKGEYPQPPPPRIPDGPNELPPFYPPPSPEPVPPAPVEPEYTIDDLIDMILAELEKMDLRGGDGVDGVDGKDGIDGKDGEPGVDGSDGMAGPVESINMDDLADRIKKKISGSIRVEIRPIPITP